jgi:hypothetical protein
MFAPISLNVATEFEYTAALESGTRILASDDVLEGAYADMTFTIRSWAEVGH